MPAIQWPAVIKLRQNDEMLYIANEQQWRAYLSEHLQDPEDIIIDSQGLLYGVYDGSVTTPTLVSSPVELTDFISLVQLYAQSLKQCCSAKIGFKTLEQGLAMVQYLNEQDT